jgi:farnesyl-diphosphate farnesyltransferase
MGKLAEFALHPLELKAAVHLKFFRESLHPRNPAVESEDVTRSYYLLKKTSRSFAAVIEELHPELRKAVMIFYLILRALDTIEDDMTIEKEVKIPLLREFDSKLLTKDWTFNGNGANEKDRIVLVEFDVILREYHTLKDEYQDVIKDVTKQMGNGMADYIENADFNLNGLKTIDDYDLYCYYVAGLVGDGLTRLIVLANFGDAKLYENKQLLKSMGLFLQKTNIIRDYEEDLADGRAFWPKEIWGNYAKELKDFVAPENREQGKNCVSELVYNALTHVEDVLHYLSLIDDQSSFNFCAIPQVMAIATLELVYQNEEIFERIVKIRKGTTCSLILKSRTFNGCIEIFQEYVRKIHHKSTPHDPNYLKIGMICGKIEQFIEEMYPNKHLPAGMEPKQTEISRQVARRTASDEIMVQIAQREQVKMGVVVRLFIVSTIGLIFFTAKFFGKV